MRSRAAGANAKPSGASRSGATGGPSVRRTRPASPRTAKPTSSVGYLLAPDTTGPRVRVGVLWFFLALASVTGGRWSSGILWGLLAATAAYQIVGTWQRHSSEGRSDAGSNSSNGTAELKYRAVAAFCAGVVPLLAAYGTGAAGLALILVPLIVIAVHSLDGQGPRRSTATLVAAILPALAAASVVLAVRIDLWAGLFLVAAVSIYDAGSFLLGAEAGSRWEGPAAGMIGVLAVTFTMAAFHPSPFDGATAWLAGGVIAMTCTFGQIVAGMSLPSPTDRARGLRRLDSYIVAGPAFLVCAAAASL